MLLEQFKNTVNGQYENVADLQKAITEVLPQIESAFNDSKSQRKEIGSKYDNSLKTIESIGKTLGLEDTKNFTLDDVSNALKSVKDDKSIDYEAKLNSEIEKYRNDFNTELTKAQQDAESAKSKLTQFEHKSLIENSNLLKDIRDETPLFKEQAMNYLMSQTMVIDGKLAVNDGNGTPAKDLKSGNLLNGDFVVSNMKDNAIYAPLFKSEQKANGMGVNPQQSNNGVYSQQTRSAQNKIADGLKNL